MSVHNGVVSAGGHRDVVPRYYRELLRGSDVALQSAILMANGEVPFDFSADCSVERLRVQEHVALANIRRRTL